MYDISQIVNYPNYKSISELISLQNILNFVLFLILVFLGVAGRISIDIEISKKSFKDVKFIPRYFLAVVLSYVVELYMAENESLRKYYAEVIILFCIFVNDILRFLLNNTSKIFFYILSTLTKVIFDAKNFLMKPENTNNNE